MGNLHAMHLGSCALVVQFGYMRRFGNGSEFRVANAASALRILSLAGTLCPLAAFLLWPKLPAVAAFKVSLQLHLHRPDLGHKAARQVTLRKSSLQRT